MGLLPLLLPGLLLFAQAGNARTLEIDPDRSSASFWVRPIWLKRIQGTFPIVEGRVNQDAVTASVWVELRIDARALQMFRADHLSWAQGPDFFDVARHPWIHFRSEPIPEAYLRTGGEVPGQLRVRDATGWVWFQLLPAECDNPGLGCPVFGSSQISRAAFGMGARRLAIGDKVHLSISIRTRAPITDAGGS